MNDIIFESTLTCLHCGHLEIEVMPTQACQFFYDCKSCGTLLKPKQGDCCVFCSYGSIKCPSTQCSAILLSKAAEVSFISK